MKILTLIASVTAALLLSGCSDKPAQMVCDTFNTCFNLSLGQAVKETQANSEFSQLKVIVAVDYDAGGDVHTKVHESSGSAEFDAIAKEQLQRSMEALLVTMEALPEAERERGDSIHINFTIQTADFPITPKVEPKPELVENFYENGQLQSRGYKLDGDKVGHWQIFFDDGSLRFDSQHPSGVQKQFSKDGLLLEEGYFEDGVKQGTFKNYDFDGHLDTLRNYQDGELIGVNERYFKDGGLEEKTLFDANGNGMHQEFWPNGALKWETALVARQPTGEQKYFDENGELIVEKALTEAKVMQQSIIDKDYDTYMRFAFSYMIEYAGGEAAFKIGTAAIIDNLQRDGIKQVSTIFNGPTKMFLQEEEVDEYYVYLPMEINMSTPIGDGVAETALIGFSKDIGQTWKFVEASIGREEVLVLLPNLPDALVIPIFPEPRLINESQTTLAAQQAAGEQKYFDQNGELIADKALVAAKVMRQSIIDKDYDAYTRFALSDVIDNAGGEAALKREIAAMMDKLQSEGLKLESTRFKKPTKIYMQEELDEYYGYLPMEINMSSPVGDIVAESALIGVSKDSGANWKFVEALGGREGVQLLLPNLPDELEIPTFPGPRLVNDKAD
ncbi:toxin-antitoxin system YwqK family antitoxin [Shewanella pealeana]|uniref:MORN variant repeat protein n=1 Tax=Shewanella pealeana (strain ATCC 700345 / ANG-SQ1) TaxID=398579 RepID=A8H836_SHEPA|nr:hypothetical protein [Shewanella pealeana]ABV88723.1 conserved hypothetical protein [Shewanella pealeana ATCC 700345]